MTWKELKLLTLQLMFSNDSATLTKDSGNQEYINTMPGVANAAILQAVQVGMPIRGQFTVILSEDVTESAAGDASLTLPVANVMYKIKLPDYCIDFRAFDPEQIYLERDGDYGPADDWAVENEDTFVIRGDAAGKYTLYYQALPTKITNDTTDDTKLGIPEELAQIIPLYMAGELYKDDDLSMAVQYRNEFEDALTKLQYARRTRQGGGTYRNTTGWW